MSRQDFHQELDRLVEEVVELGREVESDLGTMAEAMEKWDADAAWRMVGSDRLLKERGAEIAEECMVFQALQAPVASDLRLVYTVQAVTNHLVRTGTLCEHICQAVVQSAGVEHDKDLSDTLSEMAEAARNLFHEGLIVFETRDVELAHELEAMDDRIDLLYSEAMNLLVNPGEEGGGTPEWRIRAALVIHYLERIADHGVDIGEGTVFLVSGERMEMAMREYRERRLEKPGE